MDNENNGIVQPHSERGCAEDVLQELAAVMRKHNCVLQVDGNKGIVLGHITSDVMYNARALGLIRKITGSEIEWMPLNWAGDIVKQKAN